MSQIRSPSLARCYGKARVARVWKFSRASVYRSRKEMPPNTSDRDCGAAVVKPKPASASLTDTLQTVGVSTSFDEGFSTRMQGLRDP
jgi:hypothetical protein